MEPETPGLRSCLRDPIPEIYAAAFYLDEAVLAHSRGRSELAKELIIRTNLPAIREWTESLWGKNSPYLKPRVNSAVPKSIIEVERVNKRMPVSAIRRELHHRDGYLCRFCGIPLIPSEVRERLKQLYPDSLEWESTNLKQHAAFQAMWLQYDHLVPHARGGSNDVENIVITCAPCNFGRMNYTLAEVGLCDPRTHEPIRSSWDGLARPCLFPDHGLPYVFSAPE